MLLRRKKGVGLLFYSLELCTACAIGPLCDYRKWERVIKAGSSGINRPENLVALLLSPIKDIFFQLSSVAAEPQSPHRRMAIAIT